MDTDEYQHISNIVLVGGCALNKTAVGKLEPFGMTYGFQKSGDPGSCIGAACPSIKTH